MSSAMTSAEVSPGATEIATAEEKISEALTHLDKIAKVKKLASGIQQNAGKIDSECTAISSTIQRLLDQALTALAGTVSAAPSPVVEELKPGAA
jgi:tetrahydromethanopterin S-methyltransferase subunit A